MSSLCSQVSCLAGPSFTSRQSQFYQSLALSALSQVAPSSCTLCESNASHCKHRNDMLLFLATCSEQLMLGKHNFTCLYLVGTSILRCSSDSRCTVQSHRSLEAKENTLRHGEGMAHACCSRTGATSRWSILCSQSECLGFGDLFNS